MRAIVGAVATTVRDRQIPFLSAGLAFYAVLGLFPAAAATVAIFGVVASRSDAQRLVADLLSAAPADAASLLTTQLGSLTEASTAGLGAGALLSLVLLVWSASTGMRALIRSVNLVHDAGSTRSAVELRAVSFGATALAIVVVAIVFSLMTFIPTLVPDSVRTFVVWGRWPLLAVFGLVAVTALYEYAPTETPSSGWAISSVGALVALVTWLGASVLLTLYVAWIGSIDETYGAFSAAVVLLLWLYVTALSILLGAAVDHGLANAEPAS
jgi:membrane protein